MTREDAGGPSARRLCRMCQPRPSPARLKIRDRQKAARPAAPGGCGRKLDGPGAAADRTVQLIHNHTLQARPSCPAAGGEGRQLRSRGLLSVVVILYGPMGDTGLPRFLAEAGSGLAKLWQRSCNLLCLADYRLVIPQ